MKATLTRKTTMRRKRNELTALLRGMQPGETMTFPRSKRNSVRPTCTNLKYDEGLLFTTETDKDNLIVTRLNNEQWDELE